MSPEVRMLGEGYRTQPLHIVARKIPYRGVFKGQKINFFNINFLAPTQNPPCWAPRKKVYVPHFVGKNTKKGPTYTFSGGLGSKTGSQTGHFRPQKFSLLLSLALSLAEIVPLQRATRGHQASADSRRCLGNSWMGLLPSAALSSLYHPLKHRFHLPAFTAMAIGSPPKKV